MFRFRDEHAIDTNQPLLIPTTGDGFVPASSVSIYMNMKRKSQSGFTLIELMITVGVLAILAVLALPSFVESIDRRRIIDASEGLSKQIEQARTIAIQANRPISIVFDNSDAEWCFGLTDQLTCDCNAPDACQVPFSLDLTIDPGNFETVSGTRGQYSDIDMTAAPASLRFEPRRGVRIDDAAPVATITLVSARGLESRIMVNPIGRVATCSPAGSANVSGMKTCP
jgi:type IV fimbrial biogenesis protein FimT